MGAIDRTFPHARVHQREWMDTPDIDEQDFVGALAGLERINRITRGPQIVWPYLRRWAKSNAGALRVLDIGCGGGGTAVALTGRFAREGFDGRVDGCDISNTAVRYAKDRAEEMNIASRFFQMDVTLDPIPDGYDVVMSSLFLHHLSREDALAFLASCSASAQRAVLIHDLVRSRAGWWLAYAGTRALLCNAVCRADGPRSVECAFTPEEARGLAAEAGLAGAVVEPRFPCRFVLHWERAG